MAGYLFPVILAGCLAAAALAMYAGVPAERVAIAAVITTTIGGIIYCFMSSSWNEPADEAEAGDKAGDEAGDVAVNGLFGFFSYFFSKDFQRDCDGNAAAKRAAKAAAAAAAGRQLRDRVALVRARSLPAPAAEDRAIEYEFKRKTRKERRQAVKNREAYHTARSRKNMPPHMPGAQATDNIERLKDIDDSFPVRYARRRHRDEYEAKLNENERFKREQS